MNSIRSYAVGAGVLGLVLSAAAVQGQTSAHYRDFQLGADLTSVSALTGVSASEAKTVHTRPAMLQDLEWTRPYAGSSETAVDPVQQITFSFYDDQLFRLMIQYDRDRTEGMTDADMVAAISTMYGPPTKPALKANRAAVTRADEASGTRVAEWGNGEYAAVLYQSSYGSEFRMVVTSVRLTALARTAEAEAVRLDERDAPQRERARQKREADAEQASQEKARVTNKAAFKP